MSTAEKNPLKTRMLSFVRSQGYLGARPIDIQRALTDALPSYRTPHLRTIERWLSQDDRYFKPTGYAYYAVRVGSADREAGMTKPGQETTTEA